MLLAHEAKCVAPHRLEETALLLFKIVCPFMNSDIFLQVDFVDTAERTKSCVSPSIILRWCCCGPHLQYHIFASILLIFLLILKNLENGSEDSETAVVLAKNSSLRINQIDERYYHQVGLAIRLDLRWKREMSNDALATFQEIAGEVNRTYEFDG